MKLIPTFSDRAIAYANDVLSGNVDACNWIKLACKRFLADFNDKKWVFDRVQADRACKFIELLCHTKGKWAAKSERIKLEDWQVFFVCNIFGWRRPDGNRRFRRVLLLVPRKNGKSIIGAAIGIYMLCADGEYGAEIYSGATTEKQAWEVFKPAKLMALKNPQLKEAFGLQVNAKSIVKLDDNSKFEPVIGNPGDGSSPSCAIIDEYHEHASDALLNTMETGMGAREQPLALIITTAGDNLAGPCHTLQIECQRMLQGTIEMDDTFAMIYTLDAGDDWTSEQTLRKANPNFDISVSSEFLLARQKEAMTIANKQGAFQTKHLNVWVGARNAFFNVERWKSLANPDLKLEDFAGQECILALDLASKIDLTALEIVFPLEGGNFVRFGKYYLPEETVLSGSCDHYRTWMKEGILTVTDGEMTDYGRVRDDIVDICAKFDVREIAFDPFQATMLIGELMGLGLPCVEVKPTVLNLSEPMKQVDALTRAGKIRHNGDKVMTWALSNVVAKEDAKGNVFPRKETPEAKIDPAVALITAMARCLIPADDGGDFDEFLANPISL